MFELQQILHDIAKKGAETPFEGLKRDRYSKAIRTKRVRLVAPEQGNAEQLSLFQNR